MTGIRLSGILLVQDSAATVGAVLRCLERVADEIVIVDGGSRDDTLAIAAAHAKVRPYRRPFDGNLAAQKNFACDQALGDWLLILDSDELLDDEAARAIPRLVRNPFCSWYKLRRAWLVERDGALFRVESPLHYPDWQLRLFRNRPPFRYDLRRSPIHHNFPKEGRGPGRKLRRGHILHFDLVLRSRQEREDKVRRYRELDPASERTHQQYLWEDVGARLVPLPLPPLRLQRRGPGQPSSPM